MQIDAIQQKELMRAVDLLRSFIENLDTKKSCGSCCHWNNGCGLYNKEIPPPHIIENGCKSWEVFFIPF